MFRLAEPVDTLMELPPAIIILKRSVSMPKATWRLRPTRRSLPSIPIEPHVAACLSAWRSDPISPAIIEYEIGPDGAALKSPVLRKPMTGNGAVSLMFRSLVIWRN